MDSKQPETVAVGSDGLLGLTLRQLADRISEHLKRFEADKTGINKPDKPGGVTPYYWAGAHVAGRYVSVTYVTYQWHPKLTKREAAHYLSLLDGGFVGRHYEAFRRFPCPNAEVSDAGRSTPKSKGRANRHSLD